MNIIRFMKNKIKPGNTSEHDSTVKLDIDERAPKCALSTKQGTKNGSCAWPIDSIFALVGYNVNLISVWTFPGLCMKHGGIVFMIPCLISLILVVIPLYFVEISLGQRSGRGVINLWLFAPLFQGIGWASILITLLVAIYHSVHVAWCIYYLAASFTSQLPWSNCFEAPWKTPKCSQFPPNFTQSLPINQNVTYQYGLIQTTIFNGTVVLVNKTFPGFPDVWKLPADEYFNNQLLKLPNGFSGSNGLEYELVLCLLLGLVICMLSLIKGMKSGGKVLVFMVTVPYCILLAIFVRALLTDGSKTGLKLFIYPNWKKLKDIKVWGDAALVTFFMNFVSWGCVATVASYSEKKHSKFVEAFIASLGGFVYAIVFGLVVSSLIGVLSFHLNMRAENLLTTGPNLLFVTVAQGLTKLKLAPFWSALLFFCSLNVSISTLIILLETIVNGLANSSCKLLSKRCHILVVLCFIVFFSSFGLVSRKGYFIALLFQNYSTWWNILLLAFLELTVMAVFYTRINVFQLSVCSGELQSLSKFCRRTAYGRRLQWLGKCAIVLLLLIIYSFYYYIGTFYGQYKFAYGIEIIGWIFTCVPLLFIPFVGLIQIIYSDGSSFKEKLKSSLRPDAKWSVNNNTIDDDLNPAMTDTREITNQNLNSEMKVIEEQNGDLLKSAAPHQPPFEELKMHTVQKISAVEYAAKPGKINRSTQMTVDVQVQTGEGCKDGKEGKHRKRKHRHSRKKNREKAPHTLPPLPVPVNAAERKQEDGIPAKVDAESFSGSTIEYDGQNKANIENE